jgi:hypothetical protein
METNPNKLGSHFFLVRLWLDLEAADGASGDERLSGAWHGTVQHILTGKSATFNDRTALTEIFLEMMPRQNSSAEAAPPEKGATL